MAKRESLASSVGVLGLSRVAAMAMNFIAVSHMAHALDAAHFGALMFAAAYVEYFTLVACIGLENYLPRAAAARPHLSHRLAGMSLSLRLLLAAVMLPVVGASLLLAPMDSGTRLVVAIISLSMISSAFGLSAIYAGLQWMRIVAARDCAWALMNMVAAVALVRGPDDLVAAAVVTVVSTTVANAIILALYVRHFGWPRITFAWRPNLALARRSVSFLFVLLLSSVIYSFKLVVLGFAAGEAEAGLFSAAWRLFTLVVIPVHLLAAVFLPRLATQHDAAERTKAGEFFFKLVILAVLPVAGVGVVLSEPLLRFFFGAGFVAANATCALLIASSVVFAFNTVQGTVFVAAGRQDAYVRTALVGACVSLAVDLALVPRFGALGAAVSALVAQLGMAAVCLFYARPPVRVGASGVFLARCLLSFGGAVCAGLLLSRMLPLPQFTLAQLLVGGGVMVGTYSFLLYVAGFDPRGFAARVRGMS